MDGPLSEQELRALNYIRGRLLGQGDAPSVRELQHEMGYQSPRSAAKIIDQLIAKGFVDRGPKRQLRLLTPSQGEAAGDGVVRTTQVPLVGLVACGHPLLAVENTETTIPVSLDLARPPHRYFLLRARGDSMNDAGIEDGSLVLVRQQPHANDGERVVALIDDMATIKVLRRSSDAALLLPRSTNLSHKPIVLNRDFSVQGIVVAVLPRFD